MARPIKETPVLKGNDAEILLANMEAATKNPISKAELEKIKASFDKLNSLEKF
jgi:hypothetical protein